MKRSAEAVKPPATTSGVALKGSKQWSSIHSRTDAETKIKQALFSCILAIAYLCVAWNGTQRTSFKEFVHKPHTVVGLKLA